MIYYAIFIALFVSSLILIFWRKESKKFESYLFVAFSIILFVMAACRSGVGYDINPYNVFFNLIHLSDKSLIYLLNNFDMEFAFIVLFKYSSNYEVFIFAVACLGVLPKVIFFYTRQENKILCLFMYYCSIFITYDMGVIRQGVAIGILFYGLAYIRKRKLGKYLFNIILASLFHLSALFFLPLYFLADKNYKRRVYYILAIVALFLSFKISLDFLGGIFSHLPGGIISNKVQFYTTLETADITSVLVKRIIILIIFVESYKRMEIDNSDSWIYLNGYFLSVIITSLFSSMTAFGNRSTAGLYFLQMFIFSNIISRIKNNFIKFVLFIVISVLYFASLQGPLSDITGSYIPYRAIFD